MEKNCLSVWSIFGEDWLDDIENELNEKVKKAFAWAESSIPDDAKTYSYKKSSKYDNGELVETHEEEYVNGKCTKDETVCKSIEKKPIEEDDQENPSHDESKEDYKKYLEEKVSSYESQIAEMNTYIDGINDKIKALSIENDKLKAIVDNIKNCF